RAVEDADHRQAAPSFGEVEFFFPVCRRLFGFCFPILCSLLVHPSALFQFIADISDCLHCCQEPEGSFVEDRHPRGEMVSRESSRDSVLYASRSFDILVAHTRSLPKLIKIRKVAALPNET